MTVWGFFSFIIDFLSPDGCLLCGRALRDREGTEGLTIPPGWPPWTHSFLSTNFSLVLCRHIHVEAAVLCPPCWLSLEPAFSQSRIYINGTAIPLVTPFFTSDGLLSLIHFLKFSGGRTVIPPLSWFMAQALRMNLRTSTSPPPLVVPVPLHPSRERKRGYNQAALLGTSVAKQLDLDFGPAVLLRKRNTKRQARLDPAERAENVRDAFKLSQRRCAARDVVLVDDLVTTGETIKACMTALLENAPSTVTVLAAGRVRSLYPDLHV